MHQRVISRLPQKQAISKLWDDPYISVQMVAEFMEGLPKAHKEKIWNRHSTNGFIEKEKILHIIHSFVALCIKLKDRQATMPSRLELEPSLTVFIDNILNKMSNEDNGLSKDEFFNDLHIWLLEPVSGLTISEEEALQWKLRIETLEKDLLKANKEKERLQRATRVDLNSILDNLHNEQYSDKTNNELINIIKQLKARIEILTNNDDNNDDNKDNDGNDDENKNDTNNIGNNKGPPLTRMESELGNGNINQYYGDSKVEQENEEEDDIFVKQARNEIKKIENKITLLKTKRKEIFASNDNILEAEAQYNTFVSKVSLKEYNELEKEIDKKYKYKMDSMQDELEMWIKKHENQKHIKNKSVSDVHNSLFTKLLEAENEHDIMINEYEHKLEELVKSNDECNEKILLLTKNKIENMVNTNLQIDSLRKTIKFLNDKIITLNTNQNILQNCINKLTGKDGDNDDI